MKLIKKIQNAILNIRCRRAIKRCRKMNEKKINGGKWHVFVINNRPRIINRKGFRGLKEAGAINRNRSWYDFVRLYAIY
jgi:hypothetical protein